MADNTAEPGVNAQSAEVVAFTDVGVLGSAPVESQAVVLEAYAHSLSLFMDNAVSTQDAAQQVAAASIASTCAAILSSAK